MSDPTPPDAERLLLSWYADEWVNAQPHHLLRAHLFKGQREVLAMTWPMHIDDTGRGAMHGAAALCLCRSNADIAFVVEISVVPEPEEFPRARAWVTISQLRHTGVGVTQAYQLCPGTERDSLVPFMVRASDHDLTAEQMCLDVPELLRLWVDDHLALLPSTMQRISEPPKSAN